MINVKPHFLWCTVLATVHSSPAAGDLGDLGERQLQQDLFQVIHDIDPRPVYSHDHVILGPTWAGEFDDFVEAGEEQGPLEAGVVDDVFLDPHLVNMLLDIIALDNANDANKPGGILQC